MSESAGNYARKPDWLQLLVIGQRDGYGTIVSINQDPAARAALRELDSIAAVIVATKANPAGRSAKIINLIDEDLLAEALASQPKPPASGRSAAPGLLQRIRRALWGRL